MLVLDEPTNDLDIETLELLEEILVNFDGTLLLVSHDRSFMDNVVTSILVFEGNGVVNDYVGGYSDWVAKGGRLVAEGDLASPSKPAPAGNAAAPNSAETEPKPKKAKLSYKDQRELDDLPDKIESLEAKLAEFETQISAPEFYQQSKDDVEKTMKALGDLQAELEQSYQRWAELDG